ncbi:MAG: methyltransferase domain-containing protein [Clostridia bacterium]|nr:methyltransferase domain-containing protein [Clostridia bacterium]
MMQKKTNRVKITAEILRDALNDPNNADKLISQSGGIHAAWELLAEGDHRACAALGRAAKKRAVREHLEALCNVSGRTYIRLGLCSENPKMRKNTAKLLGALKNPADTDCLIHALSEESVRMVIPSLILALGAVGSDDAYAALAGYEVRLAADETEIKHEREEKEALAKALSGYGAKERHVFCGFNGEIQLICAASMGKYVAEDCTRAGLKVQSFADSSVTVFADDTEKLFCVRSFREILIPVCRLDMEHSEKARDALVRRLINMHEKSDFPFRYRVEYRGKADRKNMLAYLVEVFGCDMLTNSVSDYEAEIRVFGDGRVYLKLFTLPDKRFMYRKASVPASIAPANAASVMSCVREFFTEDAVVLDMCCGSGTMLFEREKAKPCKRLLGVDISEKAILAAKENAKTAGANVFFYNTDCRRFSLHERADEIISNLPFGNRVGTHTDNVRLYDDLFMLMPKWLKKGGIAVLYTMENTLLMQKIRENSRFELLRCIKTEAGGLMPSVAVLRLKG